MPDYAHYAVMTASAHLGLAELIIIVGIMTGLAYAFARRFAGYLPTLSLPQLSIQMILVLAIALRIPPLFTSMWYDEMFSYAVAGVDFQNLPQIIISDVHPPLPYLLLWGFTHLMGLSPVTIRLLSLVFGIVSILIFYRIAQRVIPHAAHQAVLLLAVLPMHIQYSTEARGYTLLLCVVLWALLAILEDKPKRFIVAGLLGFIHAQGFIYLACLGLLALYKWRWRWLYPVAAASMVSALWLPIAFIQSRDLADGWWNPPLTIWEAIDFLIDGSIGRAMHPIMVLPVYLPLIAVMTITLWRARKDSVLFVYVGIPLLTAVISIAWGNNVFMVRSLLPSAVMVCLLWAAQPRLHILLMPALLIAVGYQIFYPPVAFNRYLDCEGKAVFATNNHTAIMANAYNDTPIYVWSKGNDTSQWLTNEARAAFGLIPVDQPPAGACIIHHDSPVVAEEVRNYFADLQSTLNTYIAHHYLDKRIYQLWVYEP